MDLSTVVDCGKVTDERDRLFLRQARVTFQLLCKRGKAPFVHENLSDCAGFYHVGRQRLIRIAFCPKQMSQLIFQFWAGAFHLTPLPFQINKEPLI